jgi:murein DD-endopeptidase MepM/ murein hydrolase activator NlpD
LSLNGWKTAAEPSRAYHGGHTAVNARPTQDFAFAKRETDRAASVRSSLLPVAIGGAAVALIAVTAAMALPTSSASVHAAIAPPIVPASAPASPAPVERATSPDTRRFTGRVGPDLTRSLEAAGVPDMQGREYVAVLARAIRLSGGLSVDDRFDLVLEKDGDGRLGRLLYIGLDRVARSDVELLKWTDGKQMIWVNADGVGGEGQAGMRLPVVGRVTSGFGERFHPILGYERFHAGVDLGAAWGAPIAAAADGRVVSAGWRGGYGRAVEIAHASGLETLYGHMSRIAAVPGEMVHQGEVIGYVGSSGLSTGPHVHFEVLKGGRPINPMSARIGGGPGQLEGAKLQQFDDRLRAVLSGRS